jgi:hypothetical protein
VYAAFEIAASPLAYLSELGPGAVVSDFGNNRGLDGWRKANLKLFWIGLAIFSSRSTSMAR